MSEAQRSPNQVEVDGRWYWRDSFGYRKALEAEIKRLQVEVERLNLDLAQGKFRVEAVCGYCSDSGVLMLTEIERLENENSQLAAALASREDHDQSAAPNQHD